MRSVLVWILAWLFLGGSAYGLTDGGSSLMSETGGLMSAGLADGPVTPNPIKKNVVIDSSNPISESFRMLLLGGALIGIAGLFRRKVFSGQKKILDITASPS